MVACDANFLIRFAALGRDQWFISIAFAVGCISIEFVAGWELVVFRFALLVGVGILLGIAGSIGGLALEWLFHGRIDLVFVLDWVSNAHLPGVLLFVLGLALERDASVFVLDARDDLLSHLRLVPRVVGLVR
jgi:hypothetical protein